MLAGGATAPAPADQARTDPLGEVRQRLDPALKKTRDALAADRKSDLAALSALVDAAEQAFATVEKAASSPARHPRPAAVRRAGPDALIQPRHARRHAPDNRRYDFLPANWLLSCSSRGPESGEGLYRCGAVLEVPPALARPAAGLIGAALPRLAAIARQRADRLLEPSVGLLARALRSLLASASADVGLFDHVLSLGRILGSAGPIVVGVGSDRSYQIHAR